MKKFDYIFASENELDELGKQGWQVTALSMKDEDGYYVFLMEREHVPPPTPARPWSLAEKIIFIVLFVLLVLWYLNIIGVFE